MTCVGVDGCRGGWVAVWRQGAGFGEAVFPGFAAVLAAFDTRAVFAVDMPMGLPERIGPCGRGPERAARAVLGRRKPSVFSIPARAAVYACDYAAARKQALALSHPPTSVAAQAFGIFAKIVEIDTLMTPALEKRVFEVHPELAFWRLNDEVEMAHSKKSAAGLRERKRVLARHGVALPGSPPPGAASDDRLDAAACMLIAERIRAGKAAPFPDPPLRTINGRRMAIFA
jgi:predicted RNase H-like nuclease